MRPLLVLVLLVFCAPLQAVEVQGSAIQGNLIFGLAEPGSSISLDGETMRTAIKYEKMEIIEKT